MAAAATTGRGSPATRRRCEFVELNQDFALRMNEWQRDQSGEMPDIRRLSNAITLKDYPR